MGITTFSLSLLKSVIEKYKPKTVIELGAQNLFTGDKWDGPFASGWYRAQGIEYSCIDLNGENHALKLDLSKPVDFIDPADLVTDFGTSEHVRRVEDGVHQPDGFYQCWLNKWNLAKVGGVIISENPKSGSWPGHGFNYVTMDFYEVLTGKLGMFASAQIGQHAAMGNTKDGWNIWCIMIKNREEFISEEEFNSLDWRNK